MVCYGCPAAGWRHLLIHGRMTGTLCALQTSPENQLTPEALSNGYRVSYEALGISDKGELELSLCNEAEQWAPASVASYRKVRAWSSHRGVPPVWDISLKHSGHCLFCCVSVLAWVRRAL